MKNIGVMIGRFQPLHLAHVDLIKKAHKKYDQLIVLIGSSEAPLSLRNPFDKEVRRKMIDSISNELPSPRIIIDYIEDSPYNYNMWIRTVQNTVDKLTVADDKVSLIGVFKDEGSYWLNSFPRWSLDTLNTAGELLSSTNIREKFFSTLSPISFWDKFVHPTTRQIMLDWKCRDGTHNKLVKEQDFINNYKEKWVDAPYQPIFVTVDSLVLCKGHILMILRGRNPCKDQWAMPGGFVNQKETLFNAAVRELKEETNIDVDRIILESSFKHTKVFDYPLRDDRGRAISHTHFFDLKLKTLPHIKAADDANHAQWLSFAEIEQHKRAFAFDHYQIVSNITLGL